jgi:pilus assembly protein Flp/PilA
MFSYIVSLHSRLMGMRSDMMSELRREEGQGLVEYALIITFIAIVCIGGLTILGGDINELLKEVGKKL